MRKNLAVLCAVIGFAGALSPAAIATPTDTLDNPPIAIGDAIGIVGPTLNVNVASVSNLSVDHCNLMQGDSIDIRKIDGNHLLLGVARLGNQDVDFRENASGCSSGILFFLTKGTYLDLRKGYLAVMRFNEGKIFSGETTVVVEPNFSVAPVSLDSLGLESCDLLAGDSIELEVSATDFFLFRLTAVQKYDEERKDSSGCPTDTIFFLNKDQYTDARKKYLMVKEAEE